MQLYPRSVTGEDVRDLVDDPSGVSFVAQPIVDLSRGVIVGYETLARFALTSGRPSFPEEVFDAASEHDLGADLEAAIVGSALHLASTRPANCFVTINIDPLHVSSRVVQRTIAQYGDLGGIIFELTEHNTAPDLEVVKSAADALRRRGAMIAIDDAGAGYSGLRQIVELQPQFIKVDRDLVSNIHQSEAKRALVQMLGELAAKLDAWIVAEGVDGEAELTALAQLQVPLVQGYVLGRAEDPWRALFHETASMLQRIQRRFGNDAPPASASKGAKSGHPPRGPARIAELIEPPVTVPQSRDWPKAPLVIRVDAAGRPIEMRLTDDDGPRVRMEYDLLRVKRDATVSEIALRMTTRSERLRWDPVVVIDDLGHLQGIVFAHRIMSHLAQRPESDGIWTVSEPRSSPRAWRGNDT